MKRPQRLKGRRHQRGFIYPSGRQLVGLVAALALLGWVLIEGLIWLFSHISIGWAP